MPMVSPLSPDMWNRDLFSSKAVATGAVIRRRKRDIARYAGLDAFQRELDRRGFFAVENAGQVIVFCNREPVLPFDPKSAETRATARVPLSFKESGRKI